MTAALSQREQEILRLLSEDTALKTADLQGRLGVSAVTIRSHLSALAEKGYIVRTRGGALPAFHPAILDRQKSMVKEKLRIARAAASLVQDGASLMLVAGTTTSLIPRFLLGRCDVRIVTNSTLILPQARINPCLHVTVVGGEFLPAAEALVGPLALRDLEQFHTPLAFIGADGFSVASGITAHLGAVAEVVRKVAAQAARIVLLADSAKYGRVGFAHMLPLERIHTLITDDGLPETPRRELESRGIQVMAV